MKTTKYKIGQVKNAIRNPYVWPGGYPVHIVMSDGETLCSDCAKSNFRLIIQATKDDLHEPWQAEGADVNWEDENAYCCHCNKKLESAYGDD